MEVLALLKAARMTTPSTHARGKIYEQLARFALNKRYGIGVSVVGQAGDRGIDLTGRWRDLSVMAQCKSAYTKPGGVLWRDLAGIYQQNLPHQALMVLVTPAPMTAPAYTEFSSSPSPLMHCMLPHAPLSAALTSELPDISASFLNSAGRRLLKDEGLYNAYLAG